MTVRGGTVRKLSEEGVERINLKTPIEITDPNVLKRFFVWSGRGTSSKETRSFIVDWSQSPAAEPPEGLPRYEVSFYANLSKERLICIVFYQYDPSTQRGYVYLPGSTEEWYRLNTRTIFRGVDGGKLVPRLECVGRRYQAAYRER